eukprot:6367301-Prymnesium_polylepis.1
MLDTTKSSDGYGRLLCCLAAVSGRRKTEILSPRSEFEAVEGSPTMAKFTGQLKTKNEDDDLEYVIPLLCSYHTFKRGLDCLRAKQEDDYGLEDLTVLTNEAIGDKYNFIKRDLSRGAVPPFASFEIKDLRSFYAACVFQCYVCPHTFNATACQILGHREIQESLHYSNVRVEELGALEGSFVVATHPAGHLANAMLGKVWFYCETLGKPVDTDVLRGATSTVVTLVSKCSRALQSSTRYL